MASRAEPFITESLKGVRQRPGMYLAQGTGVDGLHDLGFEVIANSVDEALKRRATSISVTLSEGWLTVEDDGVGISVEKVDGALTFLESVFTSLHGSSTQRQGLRVRLLPDPEIFQSGAFEADRLETAIRRFAYLTPEVSWRFQNVLSQLDP